MSKKINKLEKIIERDLDVIWHPCTQMKDHEKIPLIPIKSGKGVWLEDFDGKKYIDAISSWWVNIFGHIFDPCDHLLGLFSAANMKTKP